MSSLVSVLSAADTSRAESNNAPQFGGPMVLRPASGDGPNVTLQADIVLNGGSDLYSAPWPSADTCASLQYLSWA